MTNQRRRHVFKWLVGVGGAVAALRASAHHTDSHFDENSTHNIVYQCNQADPEYLGHILFSVGELIRKYNEDVQIIVSCFGPGIHLLGKHPGRPVSEEYQQRAGSLADYGVAFHACGNTMKSLDWNQADLLPFAKVVPIGVEDIMLLQEKGFSYLAW